MSIALKFTRAILKEGSNGHCCSLIQEILKNVIKFHHHKNTKTEKYQTKTNEFLIPNYFTLLNIKIPYELVHKDNK